MQGCIIIIIIMNYMTCHLFKVINQNKEEPIIVTKNIDINVFDINESDNEITFLITYSQDSRLFDKLNLLEDSLIKSLMDMDMKNFPGLSLYYRNLFENKHRTPLELSQLMCPNYRNNKQTLFLKGNLDTILFRDFDANKIDYNSLYTGTYMFAIKANSAFVGQHTNPFRLASLRLELIEVFYQETSVKIPPNDDDKGLMTIKNKWDHCYCRDRLVTD